MNIRWKKSESSIKPKEIDYESSPTSIFIRRNVKEISKDEQTFFEYEEAVLTPAEYAIYAAEQNQKNVLALMEGLAAVYTIIIGG